MAHGHANQRRHEPIRMQVALRRRLRWPLPAGSGRCVGRSCQNRLDALGDHMASCHLSGRLSRRAKPLERTWARVFREAGGRVSENVFLRDTTLHHIRPTDGRRLEIVATGLPLHRGAPLGCDATMVSPLHADGTPWRRADTEAGVAIQRGEACKARTYPELVESSQLRLLTLAVETGGRWSTTCATTVRQLAAAKARSVPTHLRKTARVAYASRWWALLSVAAQNTLAATVYGDAVGVLDGIDDVEPTTVDVCYEASLAPPVSRLPAR